MQQRDYDTLLVDTVDEVSTITFNRPEARNAMNPQFHFDMRDALKDLTADKDTRVVVLTGSSGSWIAGMDLKQFFYEGWKNPRAMADAGEAGGAWNRTLRYMPKPTIAMVNGYVFGAAFSALCACDIAVADEEALLGLPEINWGIAPGGNLLFDIPEMMPFRDLMWMALTGENITGRQAADMRFVNFAVPKDELKAKVGEIAENLKKKAPEALQSTKIGTRLSLKMDREHQGALIMALSGQAGRAADARGTGGTTRAIEQFMDKKYRPAFGEYDWETSESSPR